MSLKKLKSTPKLVVELFRHGARGPLKTDDAYWRGQEGLLTNLGRAQHYVLGASMIQRYPHLKEVLKQNERVYYRTTAFSRTRESLEYHILGMHEAHEMAIDDLFIYKPTFSKKINDHAIYEKFLNANKQLIGQIDSQINVIPFEEDFEMLGTELKVCPNSFKLGGKDAETILENHFLPIYDRVEKELNMRITGQEFRYYYDYLCANHFEGRSFPSDKFTNDLWAYLKLAGDFYVVFKRFGNELQSKLFSIFLSEKIIEILKGGVDKSFPYDLVLLSAHDVTVFNMLNALNILTPRMMLSKLQDSKVEIHEFPNYASQLLFELWESEDNKSQFVRIIYENNVLKLGQNKEEFYSISALEETLRSFYAPYTKDDVYTQCGCEKYPKKTKAPKEVV